MALRHRLSIYICMMRFSADGSLLAEGVGQIALAADVVDLIAGGGILRLRRGHGHGHVAGLELYRGAIVVRDGVGDVVLPAEPEVAVGSCGHVVLLQIGVIGPHVGQICRLLGFVDASAHGGDGNRRQHRNDGHHDEHLHQREALFPFVMYHRNTS